MKERLLLIGNAGGTNVASSFERAARELGWEVRLCEAQKAYRGPRWMRRFAWHFYDRRPIGVASFAEQVLLVTRQDYPSVMISTGLTPLLAAAIMGLKELGVRCLHYSTDDPWNRAQKASWFIRSLPHYDHIFTTRRANLSDFETIGCARVSYLPFAYDPHLSFRNSITDQGSQAPDWDLLFIGGADPDRIAFIRRLPSAGVRLALYGDYWGRVRDLNQFARGWADVVLMRQLTAVAPINLCLCRRANRDGHVMRTFEIAATGGFMLAEDTDEHRGLFGREGECVLYFSSPEQALEKIKWGLAHPEERQRMAAAAKQIITVGRNTYRDRLLTMIQSQQNRPAHRVRSQIRADGTEWLPLLTT
jgi:spore maturation protein CgeB